MQTAKEVRREYALILNSLLQEHPDLQVVPMVDTDVIGEEGYGYWRGELGKPRLDAIWCQDERIYFRSSDEDELLEQEVDRLYDLFEGDKDDILEGEFDRVAKNNIEKLEWEPIIALYIGAR